MGFVALNRHYSVYASTMSWSDYQSDIQLHRISCSFCRFLGTLWFSQVPTHTFSSTRYGLRPRHASIYSPFYRIYQFWLPAYENLGPVATRIISGLNTFTLSHCGWRTALASASHSLLPYYVRGSVLDCWLGFIQVGLSNLYVPASLGALITISFQIFWIFRFQWYHFVLIKTLFLIG